MFETTKKKEVGVSDLTLISKITNEAINENLKKRFENKEIYVFLSGGRFGDGREVLTKGMTDVYRSCLDLGQSVP